MYTSGWLVEEGVWGGERYVYSSLPILTITSFYVGKPGDSTTVRTPLLQPEILFDRSAYFTPLFILRGSCAADRT